MRYGKRLNKYERKEVREKKLKMDMAGGGRYIYENNSDAELTLPKPTASGLRKVGPRQQFQGDDYYMQWVGSPHNILRFMDTITEEDEIIEEDEVIGEGVEENMEKLILDQPDTVTEQGKVEHVVESPLVPTQPLNDSNENKEDAEVLLNEDPLDGVEIILG